MSVLLQIQGAEKSFGDQLLLDDASATLVDKVKVGFVGRNGAGKSTLLRVILEQEDLERGEVIRHPSLKIGYLEQHDPFLPGESALDFLMRESGQPEWRCGEVGGEFELKGVYLDGPVSELSGGWQTRVKLASLLLREPNLLLLDEPTNFLDVRTQILLEHFLKRFNKAALIVSHDRAFLQATCDQTLDLTRGKLSLFPGKIEEFLVFQAERREHEQRANATVQARQRHLQKFIDKNRTRASTASRAKSKGKQLARLKTVEIENDLPTASIRAPIVSARQGPAVRLIDLSIGYPDHSVATGINIEIEHGQRTAIVGDNGQGKTTLLRTMARSLDSRAGTVKWGHHCELGVYAQHVYGSLDERSTVLEYLESKATADNTHQQILAVAGSLLFRDSHIHKRIRVLSGGERARLCLAGLLLGSYNILILDEPGNHLDVETVEALVEALTRYRGTVIFTSHDRHFMRKLATSIVEVRDGRVRNHEGDYDAYLYSINREIEAGELQRRPPKSKGTKRKTSSAPNPKEAEARDYDPKKIRKELKALERSIRELDAQRLKLNDQLHSETDPEAALQLHNDVKALEMELGLAEERWLELSAIDHEM